MQQKTRFIVIITLICFVSLLFLPGKTWGVNDNPFPEDGTPSDCTTETKKCVAGEWEYDDNPISPGWDYNCTE